MGSIAEPNVIALIMKLVKKEEATKVVVVGDGEKVEEGEGGGSSGRARWQGRSSDGRGCRRGQSGRRWG